MKNIVYILLLMVLFIKCGDMETKWVIKCQPAGPGNYRINSISSQKKDLYITGAYWAADQDSVCITAKYSEDGELLWHKVYPAENFTKTEGCAVYASTRELVDISRDIYILAHTEDEKGSNAVVLIKYDSLGNQHWDHIIQRSRSRINSVLFSDCQNNLYIAGWFESTQDPFLCYENSMLPRKSSSNSQYIPSFDHNTHTLEGETLSIWPLRYPTKLCFLDSVPILRLGPMAWRRGLIFSGPVGTLTDSMSLSMRLRSRNPLCVSVGR